MNIVLSSDDKYVEHCAVTLSSILHNNSKGINFYLLTEGLTAMNRDLLTNMVREKGSCLHILTVKPEDLSDFPMPSLHFLKHISIATYYRLFVSSLLPSTIDKILYLDCDIIVRHQLDELWNIDLEGHSLAAVYQIAEWNPSACKRLDIPANFGYFNAGVLLINLAYWRENNIQKKCVEYAKKNQDKIVYHDQDILNFVNHETAKMLPCTYNMMSNVFLKSILKVREFDESGSLITKCDSYKEQLPKLVKDPFIVHFTSVPKPWESNCIHPWCKEYVFFLRATPYNHTITYRRSFKDFVRSFVFYL